MCLNGLSYLLRHFKCNKKKDIFLMMMDLRVKMTVNRDCRVERVDFERESKQRLRQT